MDGIRQDEHGPQLLMSRPTRRLGGAVHFLAAWFLGGGMQDAINPLFCGGGDLADVFRTKYVNSGESDREVYCGEDDVHAESVPAVRAYEVLELLGK